MLKTESICIRNSGVGAAAILADLLPVLAYRNRFFRCRGELLPSVASARSTASWGAHKEG
jgi:hypothetical protein